MFDSFYGLKKMDLDLAVAYLVGNKIDLETSRQVAYHDGLKVRIGMSADWERE